MRGRWPSWTGAVYSLCKSGECSAAQWSLHVPSDLVVWRAREWALVGWGRSEVHGRRWTCDRPIARCGVVYSAACSGMIWKEREGIKSGEMHDDVIFMVALIADGSREG
jgi:hypothetical protein